MVLAAVAAGATLLLLVGLWLLRDPVPGMLERRSTLVEVREGPESRGRALASRSVRLRAASGLAVDLNVRAPVDTASGASLLGPDEAGRRPLFLILGGYRTGERAAMLVEETEGAVVAAMGYPYEGPLDVRGLAVLRHLPEIRRAILDTPPALQLALDYLLARPDVDPERVELVGVSLGAFLTPAAAALDGRVTRLWLIHGAGRPREVLEHGLRPFVPYSVPRALIAAGADIVFAGPRLAPERWLPQLSPRPVVIINAAAEERLPPDAVAALYRSAREPKEQIWLSGGHVHPERPDLVQEIMDVVLTHASAKERPQDPRASAVGPSGCCPRQRAAWP